MGADDDWKQISTVHLVHGAQNGAVAARDELFERYLSRVLDLVDKRLGHRLRRNLESQDIAQDVMLEALRSLDRYETRAGSSLLGWLAQIVEHRISARAKYFGAGRRSAKREVSIDAGAESGFGIDPPSPGSTPSVFLRRVEEREIVTECLHELSDAYRELILLRDFAGASWEEVARAVDASSADSARMMHARAFLQLGKLLRARGLA